MKKAIITLTMTMLAVVAFGQLPKAVTRIVNANTVTADTTYLLLTADYDYAWHVEVTWTGNNGTTTTVVPVTRTTSTGTWVTYAGMTAQALSGTTSSVPIKFEDVYGVKDMYLGLKVSVQSGKTVTLTVRIVPTIKK